jgi:ribosomal protein L14
MFQKNSFSIPSDSSGILLVKVIQTRRCSTRKHADIGKFLRVVLKNTKVKLNKRKKRRVRAIVIRSQRYYTKRDGLTYQFGVNSLVLLKKRMNTMGKELYGPTSKMLKIRKFRIAFRYIY